MSHAPSSSLKIQNVVATVRVATALDLAELAERIPGADYEKKKFPGLVLRMSSPKVVVLAFAPGKLVLTGMPHPDVLPSAFSNVLEILRDAGAELESFDPPRVVNIVTSGSFGEGVALQRLAIAMNLEHIEYEPEVFPGLVYRSEAGGVALIFTSGALIIAGALSIHQAQTVSDEVWHLVDRAGAWMQA